MRCVCDTSADPTCHSFPVGPFKKLIGAAGNSSDAELIGPMPHVATNEAMTATYLGKLESTMVVVTPSGTQAYGCVQGSIAAIETAFLITPIDRRDHTTGFNHAYTAYRVHGLELSFQNPPAATKLPPYARQQSHRSLRLRN